MSGSSGSSVLRPQCRGTAHAVPRDTEKNGGGSGAKLDGAVPPRGGPPALARSLRESRGGSGPERFPTGPGRKASPLVRRRRLASFLKRLASSAYGRSEIVPPMNRRNPTPRRRVRCDGSRCGTRGSDSPLNRLFSSPGDARSPRAVLRGHDIGAEQEKGPERDVSRLGAQSLGHAAWVREVRENRMSPFSRAPGCLPRKSVKNLTFCLAFLHNTCMIAKMTRKPATVERSEISGGFFSWASGSRSLAPR